MKKLLLIMAISLVGLVTSEAQTYTGDLYFQSQADIDNFIWTGDTKIDGNVTIQETTSGDIKNFYGLQLLDSITGDLIILNNSALEILSWLDNLKYIGRSLRVMNNPSLLSFEGLSGLQNVIGVFEITDNNALIDLKGTGDKPALGELTSIGAWLDIGHNSSLKSLKGLDKLSVVGDYLAVYDNSALKSLDGLESLKSVGKSLYFDSNTELDSIADLHSLISVGGNLTIINNSALKSLHGLENVTSIKGFLAIDSNPILSDISGISNIDPATIDDPVAGNTDLFITNNPQLSLCSVSNICELVNNKIVEIHDNFYGCNSGAEISTGCATTYSGDLVFTEQSQIDAFYVYFQNCTKIDGSVTVEETTQNDIWNFAGLSRITEVTGDLIIKKNHKLPFLSWLENLTTIGGGLIVQENANLVSFQGLSGLQTVDSIYVYLNPKLINFAGTEPGHEGLSLLTSVGKSIEISYNDDLISLEGLGELKIIGKSFHIIYNKNLKEFKGADINNPALGKLTSVGEGLDIFRNVKLTSLGGLGSVTSVGGDLWIDSNAKLTLLTGLDKVDSIGGDLWIWNNVGLTSLSGLDKVKYVRGNLNVQDNIRLKSLTGLDNIKKINGFIYIIGNDSITDIYGIRNIDPATVKSPDANFKDLNIFNNPQLSECAMDLCQFLTYPGLTTDIHDNGNLCSDVTELTDECTPPACTQLTAPVNGAVDVETNSNISWAAVTGAAGYWLQVGTTSGGTEIVDADMQQATTWDPPTDFDGGVTIYITVMPYNGAGLLASCSEESFTVEAIATGVTDTENSSGFSIYPNPARNTLYLNYDKATITNRGNIRIEIYSATGQKVKVINRITDMIDISGLGKGIYLISFITDKGTTTRKFAVAR